MTLLEAKNNMNKIVILNDPMHDMINKKFILDAIICKLRNDCWVYYVELTDENRRGIVTCSLDMIQKGE